MNISSFCLVFPGQGSQVVGMGQSYQNQPAFAEVLEEAEAVLGFSLRTLLAEGPAEVLNRTEFAQPALFCVGYGIYRVLSQMGLQPAAVAGHSLGEYTALVAAGVLPFTEALRLVQKRAQLMQRACEHTPGGMAAVLKTDHAQLEALLSAPPWRGRVVIANYNSPSQCVLSGERAVLETLMAELRQRKLGRLLPLKVSGAFHSPLMAEAQQELSAAMADLKFHAASIPVVTNLDGEVTTAAEDLRRKLQQHLLAPVRWEACVRTLRLFTSFFLEAGPGQVLSGLIRQTLPEAQTLSLEQVTVLESLLCHG